jgi:hypothetical protein
LRLGSFIQVAQSSLVDRVDRIANVLALRKAPDEVLITVQLAVQIAGPIRCAFIILLEASQFKESARHKPTRRETLHQRLEVFPVVRESHFSRREFRRMRFDELVAFCAICGANAKLASTQKQENFIHSREAATLADNCLQQSRSADECLSRGISISLKQSNSILIFPLGPRHEINA